ncbi:phage holin family protein [Paracoccus sp. TOH]|uniref:Phage holin family protein n=1 Tax=Paracoccus simplex TaxID=2086346 RepID=A0ABV7RYS8_9RHOB|nr:phage holin family protein [Paracoccus sp. TOH]WJS86692.1 phage holin family protein [Paracoccus sp. TOH]
MDTPPEPGLIEAMNKLFGGAATTLLAAFSGRLMYHAGEVRAKRRPIWSRDLAWELPTCIGMAMVGDGLADYLALTDTQSVALVAVLSYLGPRGAGAVLERWADRRR